MEKIQELSRELEEVIRRSNNVVYRRGRSILNELGISNPQFNTLQTLKEFGPMTMGDLCKHLFTACSTATDLADRLEREGLVERIRDPKDRRIVRMHLLPKGEEVVELIMKERHCFFEKVLSEYSSEESTLLLQGIERLAERMENSDKVHAVKLPEVNVNKK
jgi:MarR family transcriptional regulator, organic hydroperoxide resistance regulator